MRSKGKKKGTRRGSPHDNRYGQHNEGDRKLWALHEKRNSQQRDNENEGFRGADYSNPNASFAGEKKSSIPAHPSTFDSRIVTEYMTSRYKVLNNQFNLNNKNPSQDTPDSEGYPFNAPFRTVNTSTGWVLPPNLKKEDFPTMLRAAISDSQQKLQHVASQANTNNSEVLVSAVGQLKAQPDPIAEEGEPNDDISSTSNPIDDEYPKLTTSQDIQKSPLRKGRSTGRTSAS
eukprot:GHVP01012738.1.p1 GENE.GHVP01012738.1~~GHVP01012738.1.p1  ORF type:complete len:231 (-),score=31.12 GHVP01012738.1:1559-2251(-)